MYFYNEDNWGVEEAYKAFDPNYEVCITKDFINKCSSRVWFIDNGKKSVVDDVFKGTDYNKISETSYFTKYHDYDYKIVLLQK